MTRENQQQQNSLVEHFFLNEYGKMVAVISKYVTIETAEDIVQDTPPPTGLRVSLRPEQEIIYITIRISLLKIFISNL